MGIDLEELFEYDNYDKSKIRNKKIDNLFYEIEKIKTICDKTRKFYC